jgi:hypothetical protein
MRSKDVTSLYDQLPVGAMVQIVDGKLPNVPKAKNPVMVASPAPAAAPAPAQNPASDWAESARKTKPASPARKNVTVAQNNHPRA